MEAKVWIGSKSRMEHLRRLSVVFAVELRLKIVTELYMREMSPKQFYEEFGGGTLSRVTQNFVKLAETGWLRHIRSEGPGGRRRGATETFYRASELAFFDPETWGLLPYSIRAAFSWNSFKQIAGRLREALQHGTFDTRPSSSLTHCSLRLDQLGWQRVIEAVSAQFVALFEEQEDARLRIQHSGDDPIRASVIQIAFESAEGSDQNRRPILLESERDLVPLPIRLSKVFSDELCLKIIDEANRRPISAMQFHADFGGSLAAIQRRFRKLVQIGWLKQIGQETGGKRRGATEKFYGATGPALFSDDGPWAAVPPDLRKTERWIAFERLSALIKKSMKAGVFDTRKDSCLAWSLLQLDRIGWEKVVRELDELRALIRREEEQAATRMTDSGEEAITMIVALGAFESPKDSEREI